MTVSSISLILTLALALVQAQWGGRPLKGARRPLSAYHGAAMASPTSVEAAEARAALASVVPRLTALVRSVGNPAAPAVGE